VRNWQTNKGLISMTIKITKQVSADSLIRVVEKKADVHLGMCYQCKKCSVGCPVAGQTASPPSEIIRRLQLGAGEELLQTDLIWTCLSCETCYARCPNEINFAAVIDALRSMALDKGVVKPKGNPPLFNRLFLNTVKRFGRAYDLQMIALYKIRTGNLRQDTGKFPAMIKKGKMALLPPSGADKRKVKRIFDGITGQKGNKK
jgi:heterodisulfide reductase subunit C2